MNGKDYFEKWWIDHGASAFKDCQDTELAVIMEACSKAWNASLLQTAENFHLDYACHTQGVGSDLDFVIRYIEAHKVNILNASKSSERKT